MRMLVAVLIACGVFGVSRGEARPPEMTHERLMQASGAGPHLVTLAHGRSELVLSLTRYEVLAPEARLVVGDIERGDRELRYDRSRVRLYRGEAVGVPESHVFVAVRPGALDGWVMLGPERHVIGWREQDGAASAATRAMSPIALGGAPLSCPVEDSDEWVIDRAAPTESIEPRRHRRVVDVAIETDYEYYELFDDADRAMDYIVALYGANSAIFDRDVAVMLQLTYVRLWDTPDDLFTMNDPLTTFRAYWNNNMRFVQRDCAQFFSGQRTFPYGGVAYVSALCGGSAYSVVGYAQGSFENPAFPSVFNRDLIVTAHELGHNFGTLHNHDYGLDTCQQAVGEATRGTIMSYCGQTRMGGEANLDPRFDTVTGGRIITYIRTQPSCVIIDCNGNGVADSVDILNGFSLDVDGNGVPDECEDCNGNGVPDSIDILNGHSLDLDGNGVPDECQADCDGNGVPDAMQIAAQASLDLDRDGVLDLCQLDCDGDGVADTVQIRLDMSLDINRDNLLDSCQDCDGDGIIDLVALDRSRFVLTATLGHDRDLGEFHGLTGVRIAASAAGHYDVGNDLVITPDRRVLVSSAADHRIVEFDVTGAYIRDLVAAGQGGLAHPAAMVVDSGSLYVVSRASHAVLEYDLETGAFVREVVASASGILSQPFAMLSTPAGTLLVSSHDDRVLEIDPIGGGVLRTLVAPGSGGLLDPRGMVLKRDGNLLVTSSATGKILEYHGVTGDFVRVWNRNGSGNVLTLEEPWTLRVGHDHNIYVSDAHAHPHESPDPDRLHLTASRIMVFDWRNGNYMRSLIQGQDSALDNPGGFDFIPATTDCNANFFPDNCDVALGLSADDNNDGIPDECQRCPADFSGSSDPFDHRYGMPDGRVDADDFFYFLDLFVGGFAAADLTGSTQVNSPRYGMPDGVVDASDFFFFLDLFVSGCP
ncbi:MAG: hypothetical protein KIT24_07400 [Phycisphaeraceae bacterium]|nr:hypothetical protein [Phycisphaeraceae bacterium]